ncbi:cysteine synthase [Salidesulfovibrio brasiliensis]|uniref:cysteine synthase n=1 Tax=Salidesulfovibrio brasiliensis TaxID=221711 RepID=UPI0006D0D2E4|nr:cysteine synthase [Salidesulfovibrio brasiliensis]
MEEGILGLIGDTPLVEIRRLNPNPRVRILAKLETANPGGSVKDRVAYAMIRHAEESGELTPGKILIEATSGNTGIGLAMVAAVKGYPIRLIMPETASEERKMIMRAYGAEIELTPGHLATDGAIELAYRMAREEPDKYVLLDQYNNPACIDAHYHGTGLEIWEQTGGAVTHAVATLGTSGTAMGMAKRLHEMGDVFVAAVEPYEGHKIQGLKNMHESYPPGIYNKKWLDAVLRVDDETAFDLCRRLAAEEGIFAGMSSGAALGGAIKLAEELEEGTIVVLFPDGGERYLSTPLFAPKARQGVCVYDVARSEKTFVQTAEGTGIYTMGPSLDNPGGLDSWRRVVLADVLSRHLAARGVEAVPVAGLADMDDRTLAAAREASVSRQQYAGEVREKLRETAERMGVTDRILFPLSGDSETTALELCRKMLGKGLAYEKLRSVYFDVFRDPRYGAFGLQDVERLSAGKTVDLDAYVKDNPFDFTLLKRATLLDLKLGDVLETEWGNVRPSWFLQHAATATDAAPRTDVFIGSESHRFPHLENLRAIWSTARREVQAWMVTNHVSEDGEGGLDAVVEALGSEHAARLWLLSSHYRKPLAAGAENLTMWARNWKRVQETAATLSARQDAPGDAVPEEAEQAVFDLNAAFREAMDDDLSLHHFWPALFTFVKKANALASGGNTDGAAVRLCLEALLAIDDTLRVLDRAALPVPLGELPEDVRGLVADRQKARSNKDYAESDQLRDALAEAGYRVEDTPTGPRVIPL